jgi:hypothetical protein
MHEFSSRFIVRCQRSQAALTRFGATASEASLTLRSMLASSEKQTESGTPVDVLNTSLVSALHAIVREARHRSYTAHPRARHSAPGVA